MEKKNAIPSKAWTGIKINSKRGVLKVDLYCLRLFNDDIFVACVSERRMVG